jgi:hypothetical protein
MVPRGRALIRSDVGDQDGGTGLAVAMLADQPDTGKGDDPREALRAALEALGEPSA